MGQMKGIMKRLLTIACTEEEEVTRVEFGSTSRRWVQVCYDDGVWLWALR